MMNISDKLNINEQLHLIANKSNQHTKYAAVIIHRNKVIGIGYNHIDSYSTQINQCLLRGLQT
jgi:deoxycytidylate deaminase